MRHVVGHDLIGLDPAGVSYRDTGRIHQVLGQLDRTGRLGEAG